MPTRKINKLYTAMLEKTPVKLSKETEARLRGLEIPANSESYNWFIISIECYDEFPTFTIKNNQNYKIIDLTEKDFINA